MSNYEKIQLKDAGFSFAFRSTVPLYEQLVRAANANRGRLLGLSRRCYTASRPRLFVHSFFFSINVFRSFTNAFQLHRK